MIDSRCECEHNKPDSLDARLFFTMVLAVAPAVTMDEASSLLVTNGGSTASLRFHNGRFGRNIYARRMGQPTQRATNYTARSNIDTAQIFLHANGQRPKRAPIRQRLRRRQRHGEPHTEHGLGVLLALGRFNDFSRAFLSAPAAALRLSLAQLQNAGAISGRVG